MKIIKTLGYSLITLPLLLTGCNENNDTQKIEELISNVKSEYAPDKRVAMFDISVEKLNNTYILKGESDQPEAVNSLKNELNTGNFAITDSIQLLPAAALEGKEFGVIKLSVSNLRSNPGHSAELATQSTLGTPVNILKKENGWYLIQTPDRYLAWTDYGGVQPMTREELDNWKSLKKVIYTKTYGHSYEAADTKSQTKSDLVAGDILGLKAEHKDFYEVIYPDNSTGFISKSESEFYDNWLQNLDTTAEGLIKTSKSLMGLPYLWGGTSPKGVDCSGFTKTIYFLNGVVIPRDASQQIHTGVLIDSTRNFEKLEPGDLLFFGKKATAQSKERVIHVGMWIGDNKFIHSAGNVHISSMDKESDIFDEYNYNRYLRTKRILNEKDKGLQYLNETDIFNP